MNKRIKDALLYYGFERRLHYDGWWVHRRLSINVRVDGSAWLGTRKYDSQEDFMDELVATMERHKQRYPEYFLVF